MTKSGVKIGPTSWWKSMELIALVNNLNWFKDRVIVILSGRDFVGIQTLWNKSSIKREKKNKYGNYGRGELLKAGS